MSQINYGFPREIKKYMTSDGELFDNLEEAKRWQHILNEKAKTSYTMLWTV